MLTVKLPDISDHTDVDINLLSYSLTPSALITALESPTYRDRHTKDSFAKQVRRIVDGKTVVEIGFCCLGVATVEDGKSVANVIENKQVQFDTIEAGKDAGGFLNKKVYLPDDHWMTTKIGKDTLVNGLVAINDSYDETHFRPVVEMLRWWGTAGIIKIDWGYRLGSEGSKEAARKRWNVGRSETWLDRF